MKFIESILVFSKTDEKILIFTVQGIENNAIYLDKMEFYNKSTKIIPKARKISNL